MSAPLNGPSMEALLYQAQKKGVLPLTSKCNVGCVFCSNRYNPPSCEVFNIPERDPGEVRRTLPWLQGSNSVVVGESVTRINEGEPFTHPSILQVLEMVRESYPDHPVRVTTNGTLVTGRTADHLSDLGVELVVSLNTVGKRAEIMGDLSPDRTLKNIRALGGKVRFEGSVVALPFLTGWDDLDDTLGFLRDAGAWCIRLFSPGFSQAHPLFKQMPDDTWSRLVDYSAKAAQKLKIPVLLEPAQLPDKVARVEAVLAGSPAWKAHLFPGDVILAVSGKKVFSRRDAFEKARWEENPILTVLREGGTFPVRLVKSGNVSPGFVMFNDLDEDEWMTWERRSGARRYGDSNLILTSSLAKPLVQATLKDRDLDVRCHEVRSRFFGGNIQVAGLLTVSDFLSAFEEAVQTGGKPRQVTLPRVAFDPWGRDMEGVHFRTFEERTGCRVLLGG